MGKPKKKRVRIKKAVLAPDVVLEVLVPKGTAPVVVHDAEQGVVRIAPVPKDKVKAQTWLEWLRGK